MLLLLQLQLLPSLWEHIPSAQERHDWHANEVYDIINAPMKLQNVPLTDGEAWMRKFLCHLYPLYSGRAFLFKHLLHLSFTHIPDVGCLQLDDGRIFRLRRDPSYWNLYFFQEREPVETRLLKEILAPGDTFFDIGANYGWFTLLAAQQVGEKGEVHSFEPVKETFAELCENVHLNGAAAWCRLNQIALGREEKRSMIYLDPSRGATHATLVLPSSPAAPAQAILVKSLDQYCGENGVRKIDVLKCDVEGSEEAVFKGGEQTLSHREHPILLFEHQGPQVASSEGTDSGLVRLLRHYGYTDFWSCLKTPRHPWGKIIFHRKHPSALRNLRRTGLLERYRPGHNQDRLVRNILAFDRRVHAQRLSDLMGDIGL